jgi:hypothetical protein
LYKANATGNTRTHPGSFVYFANIVTEIIIMTILSPGIPPYMVVSLNGPFNKHDDVSSI